MVDPSTVLPKIEQQPLALASGFIDVVTKIEKTLFELHFKYFGLTRFQLGV